MQGNGCQIRRSGERWIATVGSGVRSASIKVVGEKEDGTKQVVGNHTFKVIPLPDPTLSFGSIESGDNPSKGTVGAQTRIRAAYGSDVNLTNVRFNVTGGKVKVSGLMKAGKILPGGTLDSDAKRIIRQSAGKTVTMSVQYTDPSNVRKKGTISFEVRP